MPNNHDDDDEDEDEDDDDDLPIKNGDFHCELLNCQRAMCLSHPFAGLRGFTITFWSFGGEIVLVSHPLTHSC
jgi:hypothetical protein